ncbi:TolC family protein [Parapedobacter koreensis]|uniref:Outer membrane protein, cobalt-zinc-cadmium efflux system n=1 Tax=Parapedobacter koreensis TaxID=332977 RepID=A0A1H7TAB2_9SPHI|nr:TolC family protein [Parapedobacter koreensis]SEL81334.1 outer membrane protein, cobalt-zinc-cadmium efflux system [Parapedobacter koreensis]
MRSSFFYSVVALLCCLTATVHGQSSADTLVMSRAEAEAVFLQRNLQLLAGKLEIDEAKAKVIQAKLWPNPTLSIGEVNLWSNAGAEALGHLFGTWGNHAQVAVDVEQLIQTAGKRKKLIAIEETGAAIAEQDFEDLLRSLKVEFRTELAQLYSTQQRLGTYQQVLGQLQRLLDGYGRQVQQGNVSRSEYLRLKASEVALMKTIDDIRRENGEAQRALKTWMGVGQQETLVLAGEALPDIPLAAIRALDAGTVQEWAQAHSAELTALQLGATYAERELSYERAQRVPDLTLSAGYDRGGNIMRDFIGVGVSVDLPIFHRNQGHIKAAQYRLEQSLLRAEDKKNEVSGLAVQAWKDLLAIIARKEHIGATYDADMEELLAGYHNSFVQRHISLLEYLDFLEAYLTTKDTLLDTDKELLTQYETLRYHVGNQFP